MNIFSKFVKKYGFKTDNDVNVKLFSKDKISLLCDCTVITKKYKYLEIPENIFKKQVLFIEPDKERMYRYIDRDNVLFVFYNDLPLYARVFIDKKFKFGKIVVLNPYYRFPNTIWTVYTWFDIFGEKVLYDYTPKLNMKPMMSSLTISDIFSSYSNGPNLNIFVNIDKYNLYSKEDYPQCSNCWLRSICRYRYYKTLRTVYRNCRNYLMVERHNFMRLIKLYLDYDIIDKCKDNDYTMTGDIKEVIYNAYI